ncbi:MAG: hypothetical protein IJB48_06265 [Clostridia bacterium]|nr:hypothetical protein [Clostridia bacterium]
MEEKKEMTLQEEMNPSGKKKKKQKKKMKRWKKILLWVLIPVLILTAMQITYNCVVDFIFYKATEALLQSPSSTESIELKENTSTEAELPIGEEGENPPEQSGENAPDILDAAAKKHKVTAKLSFTPEQVKKLNDKISRSDKLAVLAIIARAIPQEAYNTLLSMTNGGITRAEISRAYSILSKNLSTEDKSAIYSYYSKYVYLLEE